MRRIVVTIFMYVWWTSGAVAYYHPPIDPDRLDGREYLYLCEAGLEELAVPEPFSDIVWRLYECEQFVLKLRSNISERPVHDYDVCMPLDVENIEIVYLGMRWLDEHPEDMDKTADDVISAALYREWPCVADDPPVDGPLLRDWYQTPHNKR